MEGSAIKDSSPIAPEHFAVPAPKGGVLTVFADGWVEDRTGSQARGYWIYDLDVCGGKTLTLYLKDGTLYKQSLFAEKWNPTEQQAPLEITYEKIPKTFGRDLAEFWKKHSASEQSRQVPSETLPSGGLLQERPSGIFK